MFMIYIYDLLTGLVLDASVVDLDSLSLREFNTAFPMRRKTITKKDREKPLITGYLKNLISKRQRNTIRSNKIKYL